MANLAAYHRRRRLRGETIIVTRRSSILVLAGLGPAACGAGCGGSGSETPPIGVLIPAAFTDAPAFALA